MKILFLLILLGFATVFLGSMNEFLKPLSKWDIEKSPLTIRKYFIAGFGLIFLGLIFLIMIMP